MFLYLLLVTAEKTPVLFVTGLRYTAPIPPNQWALEDQLAIAELDDTVASSVIDADWASGSKAWKTFRASLEKHKAARRLFRKVREPVIVYFSMPGVVNEAGQPCLIPPGASALESDSWLPVERIVTEFVEAIPDGRQKLLVLDCNQHLVNWPMGITYNTFAERLEEFAADSKVAGLAILTAADAGQMSWASPQLGGTTFGHFLAIGLAGAADHEGAKPDGEVSLQELTEYVQAKVNDWAQKNRASRQRPMLYTGKVDPALFVVTHALPQSALDQYQGSLKQFAAADPSVKLEDIRELWVSLESLQTGNMSRFNPVALSGFQNRLLRLERLAYAGAAYQDEAANLADDVKAALETANQRARANSSALADHWWSSAYFETDSESTDQSSDDSPVRAVRPVTAKLHSLPLRAYFGPSNAEVDAKIPELWKRVASWDVGNEPIPLDREKAVISEALRFEETQLLVAVHQQRAGKLGGLTKALNKALQLRELAENLATPTESDDRPGDERAHYYVREALDAADRQRRLSEDALFVRYPSDVNNEQLVADAERLYATASSIRDQTNAAFSVNDRVWAETPFLAQWLLSPGGDGSFRRSESKIEDPVSSILTLLTENRALGLSLGDLRDLRWIESGTNNQLAAQMAEVQGRFEEIRDDFESVCKNIGRGNDGNEALALESALASPLIAAGRRIELLKARDTIAGELHRDFYQTLGSKSKDVTQPPATTDEAPSGSGQLSVAAETTSRWREAPLLAILGVDSAKIESTTIAKASSGFEQNCWAARSRLREAIDGELQEDDQQSLDGGITAADGSNAAIDSDQASSPFLASRLNLSRAARRARAAAPLLSEPSRDGPIAQLRLFDLQQLLFWHARRALDGFWNTVTDLDPVSIEELCRPAAPTNVRQQHYFNDAAADYLRVAKALRDTSKAVKLQYQLIENLNLRRNDATMHGLRLQAGSQSVPETPEDSSVEVEIHSPPEYADLPPGQAAVYVAKQRGRDSRALVPSAGLGGVAVPLDEGAVESLQARLTKAGGATLYAVAYFRGHEYRQDFIARTLGGALVRYDLPNYDRQSIALYGEQPRPPSIVFILDCSGSMIEPAKVEARGVEFKPRMLLARNALMTMLDELARRGTGSPRIGVWFFGHRVAWKAETYPFVVLRRDDPDAPVPDSLPPALDVERVTPLGAFGSDELGEVEQRLKGLQPYGLTPVNLAIKSAFADFQNEDEDVAKSIIVITDGENDQWHTTDTGFRPMKETSAGDVIAEWERIRKSNSQNYKPISVYIVGFGVPKEDDLTDFDEIARRTGGRREMANTGAELVARLQEQLETNSFKILGPGEKPVLADSNTGEPLPIELNTEVAVRQQDFQLPNNFQVAFPGIPEKTVKLEGGEALQLEITPDGADIVAVPYKNEVSEQVLLVAGSAGTQTDRRLRIHYPKRISQGVKFRFSIQDENSHFTPRPQQIWIEVEPVGSEASYLFYDPVFAAQTPTPVVEFTAANWPDDVASARVKFWCSDSSTKPAGADASFPLSAIRFDELQSARYQAVPSAPTIRVRTGVASNSSNEVTVIVEEKHQEGADRDEAIRVWLDANDDAIRPTSVMHRFDAGNNYARHEFIFGERNAPTELKNNVTVRVASAEKIKQNLLRIPDSRRIVVDIIDENTAHLPSTVGLTP